MRRPSLSQVGAAVCNAVATRPGAIVTVVCAGGAVPLATDAIVRALTAAKLPHRVASAGRSGRTPPLALPTAGEVLVVSEAQWVGEDDLTAVHDPSPEDGAVVLVHRSATLTPPVARAAAAARRHEAAFTLGPTTVAELRADTGVPTAEAERRIAATAGRADLLAALELDGSLVSDVTDRLSLLDPDARSAAELIAFGLDPVRLPLLQVPGARTATIDPLVVLDSEGLIDLSTAPAGARHTMLDAIAQAVQKVTIGARRAAVIELLLRDESGVLSLDLAARLDAGTDRSPAAGEVYGRAADQLASLDSAAALHWVDAARTTGMPADRLVLAESTAALGAGDPRRALAVAAAHTGSELALVRAGAWVALGDLGAAARCLDDTQLRPLSRWARVGAGTTPAGAGSVRPTDGTTSSTSSTNSNDADDSNDVDDSSNDAGRAFGDDAATTIAEAVDTWMAGDREGCVDALRRALVRHHADPTSVQWPVSPDVIAALMHAQLGNLERAERLMIDALAESRDGRAQRRTQLLTSAWLAATRGRLDDAAEVLADIPTPHLAPHEALWRAGVACSIAVRDAETDSLVPAASAALAIADANGTHLYDLGILTDIAAAARRAGMERVDELFAPARRTIDRLGSPPSLVADLAWARLRVALCCDDPTALGSAARELASLPVPAHHRLHQSVAAVLVHIDAGDVSAAEVEDVSRALAEAGQPHEAARVCGVAAVRTTSESDARRLLKHSRLYRAQRAQLKRAERVDRNVVRLSEQEVRVAQLVIEGRTHREIGATLFISAKTVEHHVAHIRVKLGAGSRAELLAAIRGYLDAA